MTLIPQCSLCLSIKGPWEQVWQVGEEGPVRITDERYATFHLCTSCLEGIISESGEDKA